MSSHEWVFTTGGYRKVTTCRLCDSDQLETALDLGQTPLANELDGTETFPLIVNQCGECEHHQLSIAVSPERLWGPSYPYQSGTSPVFRKHLEALADEVAKLKPGGRVLEIASNDGTLIDMLNFRMQAAIGVDPSGPDATMRGKLRASWPDPGIDLLLGRNRSERLFDCIIALNVFAHVDNLHSFTAAVKEALAPDGVFILEMGYAPAMADYGYFDTIYHEHMSYHSTGALAKFLSRHGLGIYQASYNKSQGGSKRYYIRHKRADDFSTDWERTRDDPNFRKLRTVIDQRSEALREAFAKLAKRGEKVAIYGAPAKLTTFLYATGLNAFPFDCVGDDNPLKVGRTTPGNHLPIVSVTEMLERRPETIMVASWNFFEDIRDKLRRLGFSGGIINPMGRIE